MTVLGEGGDDGSDRATVDRVDRPSSDIENVFAN
jgi:hypothetical protein